MLSTFQVVLLMWTAGLVLGVVFSQKIKDALTGVPVDVRTALNKIEAHTLAAVKLRVAQVANNAHLGAQDAIGPVGGAAPKPLPSPVGVSGLTGLTGPTGLTGSAS